MKKKILAAGIASILYVLLVPYLLNHVWHQQHTIKIQALNEKNESSKGTEAWVSRILIDDKEYGLSNVSASGWEDRGRLYADGKNENELVITVRADDSIRIEFVTHPYSGKILISDQGESGEVIDLYSKTEGIRTKEYMLDNRK